MIKYICILNLFLVQLYAIIRMFMKKAKIIVDWSILNRIIKSVILSEKEKLTFMKYIWYMTQNEKRQLASII